MGNKINYLKSCKNCGTKFYMRSPSEYVYKIGANYYCCYSCFIKDKKILLEKKNRKIEEELKGNK